MLLMCVGEREFNLGKLELKMKSIMGSVLIKKMTKIQLLATGDMVSSLEKLGIKKIIT